MKLYVSGPMTGIEDFNFPAFHDAANRLRLCGYEVVNPAESFGGRTDLERHIYLRKDVSDLLTVDGVALLDDWQASSGAQLEVGVAHAIRIPCWPVAVWVNRDIVPVPEIDGNVLDEARALVYGDRGRDYGHPLDDYERTAQIWSALLEHPVTAEDAIRCMIAVKLSRDVHQPKRDNRVDIAGYAECLRRVTDERLRR